MSVGGSKDRGGPPRRSGRGVTTVRLEMLLGPTEVSQATAAWISSISGRSSATRAWIMISEEQIESRLNSPPIWCACRRSAGAFIINRSAEFQAMSVNGLDLPSIHKAPRCNLVAHALYSVTCASKFNSGTDNSDDTPVMLSHPLMTESSTALASAPMAHSAAAAPGAFWRSATEPQGAARSQAFGQIG